MYSGKGIKLKTINCIIIEYIYNLLRLNNIIRYSFVKVKNIRNTCLHIRFTPTLNAF